MFAAPVLVLDVAPIQQLRVKVAQVGQRQQVLRGPRRAAPRRAAGMKRSSSSGSKGQSLWTELLA